MQGHFILSSLLSKRTVCNKIYNKQRQKIKLTTIVEQVEEKGPGFKSWPKYTKLFCDCGSTLHTTETCPLRRVRLEELRLLKNFDKDMYNFLSNVSRCKIDIKIESVDSLIELVQLLKQNEQKFWNLFFQKFCHRQDKVSFQYNNNEQSIGFWWGG